MATAFGPKASEWISLKDFFNVNGVSPHLVRLPNIFRSGSSQVSIQDSFLSNMLTVPSRLPITSLLPSGENAKDEITLTPTCCASDGFCDSFASHSLTPPSSSPVAIIEPLGENATA